MSAILLVTMSSKKSLKAVNKVQKDLYAKTKKEFISKYLWFCDQIAGEQISKLIPASYLDNVFTCRYHYLRFQVAKGNKVPAKILYEIKDLSLTFLKHQKVSIPSATGENFEVCIYDYFSIGSTIILHAKELSEKDFAYAYYVKSALKPFIDFNQTSAHNQAWNLFCGPLGITGVTWAAFNEVSYLMKLKSITFPAISSGVAYIMEVYSIPCQKLTSIVNNEPRSVFRVGFHFPEPSLHSDWSKLNIEGEEMDVYIQSHALHRLYERLEGVMKGLVYFSIHQSLKQPNIVMGSNGKLLIEFKLHKKKVGYLAATVSNNKIIILTFLFLTHSGTPEGECLKKKLGLQKEDIKYLAIDKLSAFVDSDLNENEVIKKIFIEAGCQDLFDTKEFIYEFNWKSNPRHLADFFSSYLGINSSS